LTAGAYHKTDIPAHDGELNETGPDTSDVRVYLCRKLLRDLVQGKTGEDPIRPMNDDGSETLHTVCSDTTVRLARLDDIDGGDHRQAAE
jgi:hypothetical protein